MPYRVWLYDVFNIIRGHYDAVVTYKHAVAFPYKRGKQVAMVRSTTSID